MIDRIWRQRVRTTNPEPRTLNPLQERGQAMVEMALVMGILLMVILGGIDGLQILMTQYTVNQAVRASAHQAALIGGPDGSNGSLKTNGTHATGTVADTARTLLNSGMTTSADNA